MPSLSTTPALLAGVLSCLFILPLARADDAPLEVTIPEGPLVAANPLGNGYNVAFFERGMCDALNDPAAGADLTAALQGIRATSLRFPGGSFTYWYPHERQGLAALKRAGFAEASYNLWWPDKYGWASEEAFFTFCRTAGLTAWFEINPAYLYDGEAGCIGQFAPLPRSGAKLDVKLDPAKYLPLALARARSRAQWCRDNCVSVVWELGNEDYCYFEPEGYAQLAAQFMAAIREVDPTARFALCGDSESWSTRDWQTRMVQALREAGVTHLDFTSVHCYLTGVGEVDAAGAWHPLPRDTPADFLSSTVRAWQLLRGMYLTDYRRILDDAGFRDTRFAFTEFNPIHSDHLHSDAAKALEHCMGRALGEATIYPFLIDDAGAIFSHDLVRSGPGTGTYFRRLEYDPKASPKYTLPLEARVMGLVALHAQGQGLYKDWAGVCISAQPWGVYVTVVNGGSDPREVPVQITGGQPIARTTLETVTAPTLGSVDFDCEYKAAPGPRVVEGKLDVVAPPTGVTAVKLAY